MCVYSGSYALVKGVLYIYSMPADRAEFVCAEYFAHHTFGIWMCASTWQFRMYWANLKYMAERRIVMPASNNNNENHNQ